MKPKVSEFCPIFGTTSMIVSVILSILVICLSFVAAFCFFLMVDKTRAAKRKVDVVFRRNKELAKDLEESRAKLRDALKRIRRYKSSQKSSQSNNEWITDKAIVPSKMIIADPSKSESLDPSEQLKSPSSEHETRGQRENDSSRNVGSEFENHVKVTSMLRRSLDRKKQQPETRKTPQNQPTAAIPLDLDRTQSSSRQAIHLSGEVIGSSGGSKSKNHDPSVKSNEKASKPGEITVSPNGSVIAMNVCKPDYSKEK